MVEFNWFHPNGIKRKPSSCLPKSSRPTATDEHLTNSIYLGKDSLDFRVYCAGRFQDFPVLLVNPFFSLPLAKLK